MPLCACCAIPARTGSSQPLLRAGQPAPLKGFRSFVGSLLYLLIYLLSASNPIIPIRLFIQHPHLRVHLAASSGCDATHLPATPLIHHLLIHSSTYLPLSIVNCILPSQLLQLIVQVFRCVVIYLSALVVCLSVCAACALSCLRCIRSLWTVGREWEASSGKSEHGKFNIHAGITVGICHRGWRQWPSRRRPAQRNMRWHCR